MKYSFITLLFLLSGCIPLSYDLGSGYILGYGTDNFDRIIYFKKAEGGAQIVFYENSKKIERFFKNEEGIITSYVCQVAFDDNYLIVDQKPVDSICECNFESFQIKYKDSSDLPTSKMCENGIKNSIIHFYYIVDKKKNIIIGPFSKEKLDEQRKKLGVKDDLKFCYSNY